MVVAMKFRTVALVVALACGRPAAAQLPTASPPARRAEPAPASVPDAQAPATNPFLGSVPQGTPTSEPIPLSLKETVERALKYNLGLLL